MFSRLEALPESESRHELGAKEGFVKGEIMGEAHGEIGKKNIVCDNEAFEGRGFEELGFRGG